MATSERSFGAGGVQTVTSAREPIYSDFTLPELKDLQARKKKTPVQRQGDQLGGGSMMGAQPAGAEYDYEALYAQPDTWGGYSSWTPGMGYGMNTAPVAIGTRKVRRR